MTREEEQVQTGIRLPKSLIERLDKLAERTSQPGMKITRTEVHRLALYRGVEQLESDPNPATKRERRRG